MKSKLPKNLIIDSGRHKTEYRLEPELVGKPREKLSPDDEIVADARQLDCVVVRHHEDEGAKPESPAASNDKAAPGRPVYRMGRHGSIAIPTGRLFVRMDPAVRLADQAENLKESGLHIDKSYDWAPNAGWVRGDSDDFSDVLSKIDLISDRLKAHVEPELISIAERKLDTAR